MRLLARILAESGCVPPKTDSRRFDGRFSEEEAYAAATCNDSCLDLCSEMMEVRKDSDCYLDDEGNGDQILLANVPLKRGENRPGHIAKSFVFARRLESDVSRPYTDSLKLKYIRGLLVLSLRLLCALHLCGASFAMQ